MEGKKVERINRTLSRISNSQNFQQRYEEMKSEILNNPDVQAFLQEHQYEINERMIEKGLMKLYEYATQTKSCSKCPNVDGCENMMKCCEPGIALVRGSIEVQYRTCPTKITDDGRKRTEKLIKSIYVPKEILQASCADFSIDS